ncbi:MAG: hypothetical protein CV082_14085 [Candidatus Brocadia sp. BL1]|nr:MAG: hypothetical protein CV082_14085 [Candidatus Brocadia sp. BL1]
MGVQYGHLSPVEAAAQNSRFWLVDIHQRPHKTRICWPPGGLYLELQGGTDKLVCPCDKTKTRA